MTVLLGVLEVTSDKVDQKLGGTARMKALIACGRSGELGVSKCDIQSLCGPSSQANWVSWGAHLCPVLLLPAPQCPRTMPMSAHALQS